MDQSHPPVPEPTPPPKPRFDRSDIIAFLALAISIASTVISVQETSILTRQQELMADEKAAAAWPYIDDNTKLSYRDTFITFTYEIKNKGIGPAILDEVHFFFDDQEIDVHDIEQIVDKVIPGFGVTKLQSANLGSSVFAPNDETILIMLQFSRKDGAPPPLGELGDRFHIEFCYCSIYGDCWAFQEDGWPKSTSECNVSMMISGG